MTLQLVKEKNIIMQGLKNRKKENLLVCVVKQETPKKEDKEKLVEEVGFELEGM